MDDVSRSVFVFGSPCNSNYGKVVFLPNGQLYGYQHENEHTWRMDGEELCLLNIQGQVSSRYHRTGNGWAGTVEGRRYPLYLNTLITTDTCETPGLPPVMVNTIPKAGTYYVEAALKAAGCPSHRLHLGGEDVVDDYRGLPDERVHIMPETLRLYCPLDLVTATLQGGHVVAHCDFQHIIDHVRSQGVLVLSVVRNLRDIMKSMFRFLLYMIPPEPDDFLGQFWREQEGDARVTAFLAVEHERGLEHVRQMARMILADTSPQSIVLRYESLKQGDLQPHNIEKLQAINPEFTQRLSDAFVQTYGARTPTFSGEARQQPDPWCDVFEAYFHKSGMADLNAQLGYA